jgi:Holliday junction DNA helicase RuvA
MRVIAYIEGELTRGGSEAVVTVGGGVGLDVRLSARGAEQLPAAGATVRLWTHLAVREDGWTLYGFPSAAERDMFRLLVSVSGIGPKVALGILSGAGPADLTLFLRTGDERSLARLPGIGKKSAARLVVELGQRVPTEGVPTAADSGAGADAGPLGEAMAVLGAMGLLPAQAERALQSARRDDPAVADDLERWIKVALQRV